MSTRGSIGRWVGGNPVRFFSVYHHWDSYPSGLGKTLWDLYHGYFKEDLEAMLKVLIDDHPAGWSSINGADFNLPAGYSEWPNQDTLCESCGKEDWRHYKQYYKGKKERLPARKHWNPTNDVLVLGHSPVHSSENEPAAGPKCFCHGGRSEKGSVVTEENASGMGCEWVYAFDVKGGKRLMHILSSYCDPKGEFAGEKMIGAFGCGDPKAIWKDVEVVDLYGKEPNWKSIEGR
jgi:hypothetical protein